MTKSMRKQFVRPTFLEGKSGGEVADDAQRILSQKQDSQSAAAIIGTIENLWDEKIAQSKTNADNAAKPRAKDKDTGRVTTADEIEQARKGYVAQYGSDRGFWTKTAPGSFGLSARTVKRRWREKFGTANAKAK